jgi:hypothetical protein
MLVWILRFISRLAVSLKTAPKSQDVASQKGFKPGFKIVLETLGRHKLLHKKNLQWLTFRIYSILAALYMR